MDPYLIQIIESIALITIVALLRFLFRKSTRRMASSLNLNPERKTLMTQTVNTFLSLVAFVALIAIWSIDTKELIFFISSLLTALGIAFLAQWSILSNITASMVLFFKHPLKIGESIKILDKDYPIEGKLVKISLIFMHIELDNGEHITIPNNIVLNKIISVKMD
jgi:small-conductance mechanosensitive channel